MALRYRKHVESRAALEFALQTQHSLDGKDLRTTFSIFPTTNHILAPLLFMLLQKTYSQYINVESKHICLW